jgi:hypothetical protein
MTFDIQERLGENSRLHDGARALITDETASLFDVDTGPLGSDKGHDAFLEFSAWRRANERASLEECLRWIVASWDTPFFSSAPLEDALREWLAADKDGALDFGDEIYARDETVIATAMAQLFLEGGVDGRAKRFIEIALARQGHPVTIARLFEDHRARAERARALAEATRLVSLAANPS